MHVAPDGSVSIPKQYQDLCGLYPDTEVEFRLENGHLFILPATQDEAKGKRLVEHMQRFIRHGGPSADEIMEWTRGE